MGPGGVDGVVISSEVAALFLFRGHPSSWNWDQGDIATLLSARGTKQDEACSAVLRHDVVEEKKRKCLPQRRQKTHIFNTLHMDVSSRRDCDLSLSTGEAVNRSRSLKPGCLPKKGVKGGSPPWLNLDVNSVSGWERRQAC